MCTYFSFYVNLIILDLLIDFLKLFKGFIMYQHTIVCNLETRNVNGSAQ